MFLIIYMLAFYYQASGIKSHRNTIHQPASLPTQHTHSNQSKTKQRNHHQENTAQIALPSQQVIPVQNLCHQPNQQKPRIFKNLAIKQKLREMEAWRTEERMRKKLAQERAETKDYEASVQQYLVKKITQNIHNSEREKAAGRPQKTNIRRYRTHHSPSPSRSSQDYLSTITLSQRHEQPVEKPRQKKSNLIGREESLLAHILRKQREFQQKSLKIVTTRKAQRNVDRSMGSSAQKWVNHSFLGDSNTNILNKCKAEYMVALRSAPKQSTETLLKPWDHS